MGKGKKANLKQAAQEEGDESSSEELQTTQKIKGKKQRGAKVKVDSGAELDSDELTDSEEEESKPKPKKNNKESETSKKKGQKS